MKKGSSLYIEGRIRTRKWKDKDGQDRYTTEIEATEMQMIGGKQSADEPQEKQQPSGKAKPSFEDMDSDIPF